MKLYGFVILLVYLISWSKINLYKHRVFCIKQNETIMKSYAIIPPPPTHERI